MTEIPRVPGRAYQMARDPERLLIEERAEALSLLGYPLLLDDDPAMHAEQRLKEAKDAARLAQVGAAHEHLTTEKDA
ncbi:hypothetical protein PSH79_20435 [Pseudomonas sp. FP2196]|uniref:hypothetical protein n=1 Tax=Pseudomonas sp. FP2196 TaxID=2954086 RepID=UPI0027356311|nr:hypothetical protein [Pseudomonas sp. FP2196]WLH34285.1 hypothetical protein PSH79_20435 [Pseudomonas sp. FP2196]